jgi:hypothetical protein
MAVLVAVRIGFYGVFVRAGAAINTYKPFVMSDYATRCNFVQMVHFPLLTDRL